MTGAVGSTIAAIAPEYNIGSSRRPATRKSDCVVALRFPQKPNAIMPAR